jgi:tetratricopeptide (TPR) repeat protein
MPERTGGPDLAEVLMTFLAAPAGSAQERVLRAHPELLSEGVDGALADLAAVARTEDPTWVDTIERSREYLKHRRSTGEQDLFPSGAVVLAIPDDLADAWEALSRADKLDVTELLHQHPVLLGQRFGDLLRGAQAEAQAVGDDALATWLRGWLDTFDKYRVGVAATVAEEMADVHIDDVVLNGMDALLAAPDWPACGPIVLGTPQLLSDEADLLCRVLLQVARALGDETAVATYHKAWEFLRSCRSHGLAVAVASFSGWAGVVPDDLAALHAATTIRVSSAIRSTDLSSLRAALADAERLLSHPDAASAPEAFTAAALILGGIALLRIGELTRDRAALEAAIERLEDAQARLPDGAPEQVACLADLGAALKERFRWTDDLDDLRRAGDCFASAADHATPFSAERQRLTVAARDLVLDIARRTGEIELLDRLIGLKEEDVRFGRQVPAQQAERALTLGSSLSAKYEFTGDAASRTAMIDVTTKAADELGQVPQRPWLLDMAGFGLLQQYADSGEPADLDRSLALLDAAVEAAKPGSIELSVSLDHLGCALRDRYARSGNRADLDRGIELAERAVRDAPDLPENVSFEPINLGNALIDRYRITGDARDLNRAIELFQQAASSTPDKAEHYARFSCLAIGLMVRHHRTGDLTDLDNAIRLLQQALDALPDRSTGRFRILTALAMALHERYDRLGDPADLNQAIRLLEWVIAEESPQATLYASHLGHLATGLIYRWHSSAGRPGDQEAAIQALEKAVALTEPGSEWHMRLVANLGGALVERGLRRSLSGQPDDLTRAIEFLTPVVQATAQGTPEWAARMGNLASAFRIRSEESDACDDVVQATESYRLACSAGVDAAPGHVLDISRNWSAWAIDRQSWAEATEAAEYGLGAMRHLFRSQLGRAEKEAWLRKAVEMPPLAAYAAAAEGELHDAVAALESGRALILSEVLDLEAADIKSLTATGHERLSSRYRSVVDRWQELSSLRDHLHRDAAYLDLWTPTQPHSSLLAQALAFRSS